MSPRTRRLLPLYVALGAALVLLAFAPVYDASRLHLAGKFVDQGGYLLTGRALADTGELRMGLIYPAYYGAEK